MPENEDSESRKTSVVVPPAPARDMPLKELLKQNRQRRGREAVANALRQVPSVRLLDDLVVEQGVLDDFPPLPRLNEPLPDARRLSHPCHDGDRRNWLSHLWSPKVNDPLVVIMSTDIGDDLELKGARAIGVSVACVVIDPLVALYDLWSQDRFRELTVYDVLSRTYVRVFDDESEYVGWTHARNSFNPS